jgi:3alpha(or 20beta)-hydroxysteroid dehydrogenase
MTHNLDGQIIIISGGARGMGAAQVRLAVAAGAFVVAGDILKEEGKALQAELGERCRFLRLDVTVEADWQKAVEVAQSLGPVTGLVNNAGIYLPRPLMETDPDNFLRHTQVNQFGVYLGMRAVVPALIAGGGGSIVNFSSTAGLRGSPNSFAYSATKWAVRGMTKSAAMDLARHGIRVNSIHPGPVDTEMLSVRSAAQMQERLARVPLKRMAQAEEVVQLSLYLLSPASSFVTGAEFTIDGGAAL